MALTITNNGDGTSTARWEATAATAKIIALATDAGRYIYPIRWQLYDEQDPPQPRAWDDLTPLEKLAVVNSEIQYNLVQMARTFHVVDAKETAGETAASEADTLYDIG